MTERTPKGRFPAGVSGNPAGRPRGIDAVKALLEPHRPALVARAIDLALAGDTVALKVCLDRLAPLPRAQLEPVEVPGLADAVTISDKARAVVDAAGRGDISPDAAGVLLGAMASACRVAEFDELQRRIAALELRDLL